MTFAAIIPAGHFADAMGAAAAVTTRSNIPVLAFAKLTGGGDRLTITTTNLEQTMTITVPAREAAGETLAPAKLLHDFAAKADAKTDIAAAMDGPRLALSQGRTRLKLNVLPASDFPGIDPVEAGDSWNVAAKEFLARLARAATCASNEATRYYLNGVNILADPKCPALFGTDGHRLARERLDDMPPPAAWGSIILPNATVTLFGKAFAGQDTITLCTNDNRITAQTKTISITSTLVAGTFPDANRLISEDEKIHTIVTVDAFRAAVERVSMVDSGEKVTGATMVWREGEIELITRGPDGEISDVIPAEFGPQGAPELRWGFNVKYLRSILDVPAAKGRLRLCHMGETSPMHVLSAAEPKISQAKSVRLVMPMRV